MENKLRMQQHRTFFTSPKLFGKLVRVWVVIRPIVLKCKILMACVIGIPCVTILRPVSFHFLTLGVTLTGVQGTSRGILLTMSLLINGIAKSLFHELASTVHCQA